MTLESSSTAGNNLHIAAFTGPLGAEISKIDLCEPLGTFQITALKEALTKYLVLVFRKQYLTDAAHVAFGARFGSLEGHINKPTRHKEHEKVQIFSNIKADGTTIGIHPERGTLVWHTDKSYVAEPSLATILRSPAIARTGGDTLFTNTQVAYDDLDAATKAQIDGLKAVHSWQRSREKCGEKPATAEQLAAAPPVQHPIVRTHPVTGRKGLYIGNHASHIAGMDVAAGEELLAALEAHATQEKYIYRHRWQVNDVVMWDNRGTLHCVTPYDAVREKRAIHRVVVKGDRPY